MFSEFYSECFQKVQQRFMKWLDNEGQGETAVLLNVNRCVVEMSQTLCGRTVT